MATLKQQRLSAFFKPANVVASPATDETVTPTPPRQPRSSRRRAAQEEAEVPKDAELEGNQVAKRTRRSLAAADTPSPPPPPLCATTSRSLWPLLHARLLGRGGNARAFVRDVMAHNLGDLCPVAACDSVGRLEAYCLSVSSAHGLIAFGGKNGAVAVLPAAPFFSARPVRPLAATGALSFEEVLIDPPKFAGLGLHTRWTSDVCFMGRDRLVTSSDDGTVCVWSVNDECRSLRAAGSAELVPDVGVFACDTNGDAICAALKNSTVHVLDAHTMQKTRVMHDAHDGQVVKCVRLQGSRVASCGNNMALRLADLRSTAVQVVPKLHKRTANSVAWNPCDSTKLMTAGYDGLVHVLDTRCLERPIVSAMVYDVACVAHAPIMKPAWAGFGTRIAALSPDGFHVRNFALATGEPLSSVDAPFALKMAQLASDRHQQDFLFAVASSGCTIAMQVASGDAANEAGDDDDDDDDDF